LSSVQCSHITILINTLGLLLKGKHAIRLIQDGIQLILDAQSFRGTDYCLMVAKVMDLPPLRKLGIQKFDMKRFNLKNLNDVMMEAARTSETLVNFYQTTQCYNPEDSHLCTHCHENFKSH
jgi:hypothetical protein